MKQNFDGGGKKVLEGFSFHLMTFFAGPISWGK
jgi:hypothetical protein